MDNRTLILRPSELKEGDVVDFIWLSTTGETQYNNITVSGSGRKLSFKYVDKDGKCCRMINQHDADRDIFEYITNVMRHDTMSNEQVIDALANKKSADDGLSTALSDWWDEIVANACNPADDIKKEIHKKDRYYTDESIVIKNPKIRNGIVSFKIKGGTGEMPFKKFASFRKCTKKEIRKFIF